MSDSIWSPCIEDTPLLPDGMEPLGLSKSLHQVGDCTPEHHQQVLTELKAARRDGGLVALTGVVGSGKTMRLWRLQDQLRQAGEIEGSASLVFDGPRVHLSTLNLALFDDLATDKDGDLPAKPDKSERALLHLMHRGDKPIAWLVDDAHDLPSQTLRGLKQLIEKTRRRGTRRAVVLAGHPKLTHARRRPALEEIGARATVFELEGIKGQQRRAITWWLAHCAASVAPTEILAPEALALLAERWLTPLQIEHSLTRALAQAYRLGAKPVTPAVVTRTLAPDMPGLEPT